MEQPFTYLILTTNIPYGEANVFIFHSLHIESWWRYEVSNSDRETNANLVCMNFNVIYILNVANNRKIIQRNFLKQILSFKILGTNAFGLKNIDNDNN